MNAGRLKANMYDAGDFLKVFVPDDIEVAGLDIGPPLVAHLDMRGDAVRGAELRDAILTKLTELAVSYTLVETGKRRDDREETYTITTPLWALRIGGIPTAFVREIVKSGAGLEEEPDFENVTGEFDEEGTV